MSYHALSLSEGRDASGTDADDNTPSLLLMWHNEPMRLVWHNAVASTSFLQTEERHTQC